MLKEIVTAVAIVTLSSSAFAWGGGGSTTNNTTNNYGGAGGAGGAGGNGSAAASASSNGGKQKQGQQQGQIGINKNDVSSKNKNSNKNHNHSNSNSDSSSYSGAISGAAAVQGQDASSKNVIGIEGDNFEAPDIPVNTAISPELLGTSDCLGSISAGGQGQFLGLTFGKTTQSNPCNVRENTKIAKALFPKDAVLQKAIMCQDDTYKEAFKVTGDYHTVCVGAKAESDTKNWGMTSVKAYEDAKVCKYPTETCKKFKKGVY